MRSSFRRNRFSLTFSSGFKDSPLCCEMYLSFILQVKLQSMLIGVLLVQLIWDGANGGRN